MPNNHVEFGWAAAPMKEQHPTLDDETAAHFDKDNQALTRLIIRGYITDSQRQSIIKKVTHKIAAEIRATLPSE